MTSGVPLSGGIHTRKCEIIKLTDKRFKIILKQGLNRQIRRMCEHFDYKVKKLKRVRIMNVNLDIPTGNWRYLSNEEVEEIKKITSKKQSK